MSLDRIAEALERIARVLEGFEPVTAEPCGHEKRQDLSTMGQERWRCTECGYSVGCEGVVL